MEPSVDKRATRNRQAKQAIAWHARQMIDPGHTIALDVGTTTFELAEVLRETPLRVFTHSLKIAAHLSRGRPNVYVPGGQVSGTEPSITGPRAMEYLGSFYFDTAFIGVSGVTAEGFFDYSLEDTEIKRTLIGRAQKTVILLDSSKFERMSAALVAELGEVDLLITDRRPPDRLGEALDGAGVRVEVAGGGIQPKGSSR